MLLAHSDSLREKTETSSYNRSVVGHDFLQVIDTISYTEGDQQSQKWRDEFRNSLILRSSSLNQKE